MIIKDLKFSCTDKKYKMGPLVEFIGELAVPSLNYDAIVTVIQEMYPDYDNINVMTFLRP